MIILISIGSFFMILGMIIAGAEMIDRKEGMDMGNLGGGLIIGFIGIILIIIGITKGGIYG